jgi:TPR repeat protein
VSTGLDKQVQRFEDADSVRASFSGGAVLAVKLEAEMERGTKLDIAYANVGRITAPIFELSKNALEGDCDGATHFVAEASIGAFLMRKSAEANAGVSAEVFDQGVSAGSKSTAESEASSGSANDCEAGKESNSPVDGCDHPLQVELVALNDDPVDDDAAPPPPPAPELRPPPLCRPGTVRVGKACISVSKAKTQTCALGAYTDCSSQCGRGDAKSCTLLGFMLEKGMGVKADARRAFGYYDTACGKGEQDGCAGAGILLSKGDGVTADVKRATAMLREACSRGSGRACSGLGNQARVAGRDAEAIQLLDRGCKLRYARACFYAGGVKVKTKDFEGAVASHTDACFGGDLRGCLAAAALVSMGKATLHESKVKFLLSRGVNGLDSRCKNRDGEACEALGEYHAGKYDPKHRDSGKAKDYLGKACSLGIDDACKP